MLGTEKKYENVLFVYSMDPKRQENPERGT